MKNKLLILLFTILPSCLVFHDIHSGMPAVADVFKGMSEDDIIKQVQEAEKFLQDLQQFGTPEEQAQFNKILEETLNSMSEQDFNDIQNIAQMVEPHLQTPEPVSKPIPTEAPKAKEENVQKASEDALENFKTLITSIIARIDEMLQKFDSSKACKEEVDTRWKNRATLNSMKRQIAQLRVTRLAEKLSKKDLSEEDKSLVDTLEKFLKEITTKNNTLVIEDSFGFETKEEENKYLKQTKSILSLLDDYIDTLMPKLEKFLTKWDPEALQLAKEAADKTAKANKEAQDALVRKGSAPAAPAQKAPYPVQQGSGRNAYGSNAQAYYPDYYDQYGGGNYGSPNSYSDNKGDISSRGGSAASPSSAPSGKAQTPAQQVNQNLKNQHSNMVDDFKESIDSYFEKYDASSESNNINFLNEKVGKGYSALNKKLNDRFNQTPSRAPDGQSKANWEGFFDWYKGSVLPYSTDIIKSLDTDQKKFIHELKSAPRLCEDIHSAIHDMTTEEVKKITPHLDKLEQRFKKYHNSYEATIKEIAQTFLANNQTISDPDKQMTPNSDVQGAHKMYNDNHEAFLAKLRSEIGDRINTVISHIDDLKAKIRHKSKRKSKSSALAQQAVPQQVAAA